MDMICAAKRAFTHPIVCFSLWPNCRHILFMEHSYIIHTLKLEHNWFLLLTQMKMFITFEMAEIYIREFASWKNLKKSSQRRIFELATFRPSFVFISFTFFRYLASFCLTKYFRGTLVVASKLVFLNYVIQNSTKRVIWEFQSFFIKWANEDAEVIIALNKQLSNF